MATPDERLINALQEFGAARLEVQQLRADLKETAGIVQALAKQITRIEAQAEAARIGDRVTTIETKVQALEWDRAARIGGGESVSKVWKYTTGFLTIVLAVLAALFGWLKYAKGT